MRDTKKLYNSDVISLSEGENFAYNTGARRYSLLL